MLVVYSLPELKEASIDNLIIGYARVSTELSHQDSSIERQIVTYEKLGANLIVVERDSGRDIDRPLYQEIVRLIKVKKISKIITTRSDRLLRNAAEQEYFYRLCTELNVAWHFTDQPELNPDSPVGRELRARTAYEAQQESDRLSRRIERAYAFAEEEGKANTRIHPLGYRVNKEKKYEIDWLKSDGSNIVGYLNDKACASGELARYLVDLYLKEKTLYKALRCWKLNYIEKLHPIVDSERQKKFLAYTDNSLSDWLKNPILQGHTAYGKYKKTYYGDKLEKTRFVQQPPQLWRIKYNTHPQQALITYQEYKAIERLLKANVSRGYVFAEFMHSKKPQYPISFSTILRCNTCGLKFKVASTYKNGKRYASYYCQGRAQYRCKQPTFSEKILVPQLITKVVLNAEAISQEITRSLCGEAATSPKEIQILKEEADSTLEKYKITGISEYAEINRKLEARIKELENVYQQEQKVYLEQEKLIRAIASVDFWRSLPAVELHRYLREVIQVCWIDNRSIVSLDLNI